METKVPDQTFPPGAIEVLRVIRSSGGMTCTGSCHQQKKEHVHCRQIGKILEIGFSAVWDRLGFLLRGGFVHRNADGGAVLFTITRKGEEALDARFS